MSKKVHTTGKNIDPGIAHTASHRIPVKLILNGSMYFSPKVEVIIRNDGYVAHESWNGIVNDRGYPSTVEVTVIIGGGSDLFRIHICGIIFGVGIGDSGQLRHMMEIPFLAEFK